MASASMMTKHVAGASTADALRLFGAFHDMLTGASDPEVDELDKLVALAGVREYPSRVKCASLAWHALKAALSSDRDSVSTE